MLPAALSGMKHYRGDLWRDGYRRFGPMNDENNLPPGAPCLYCRMQFRDKKTGVLGYELNSDPAVTEGTIEIEDAVNYEFFIPDQGLPLEAGTYVWDFETYLTADHTDPPITWFTGTMTVLSDVSHD